MNHELKTWVHYYNEIVNGRKKFELRKNDRDFKVGDLLILQEYDNDTKEYTGSSCIVSVDYILHGGSFGLDEGYCIMSIFMLKTFPNSFLNGNN